MTSNIRESFTPTTTADSLLVTETLLYHVTPVTPSNTTRPSTSASINSRNSNSSSSSRLNKRVSFSGNTNAARNERPSTATEITSTQDNATVTTPTTPATKLQWMSPEAAEGIDSDEDEDDIDNIDGLVLQVTTSIKKSTTHKKRKKRRKRRSKSPPMKSSVNNMISTIKPSPIITKKKTKPGKVKVSTCSLGSAKKRLKSPSISKKTSILITIRNEEIFKTKLPISFKSTMVTTSAAAAAAATTSTVTTTTATATTTNSSFPDHFPPRPDTGQSMSTITTTHGNNNNNIGTSSSPSTSSRHGVFTPPVSLLTRNLTPASRERRERRATPVTDALLWHTSTIATTTNEHGLYINEEDRNAMISSRPGSRPNNDNSFFSLPSPMNSPKNNSRGNSRGNSCGNNSRGNSRGYSRGNSRGSILISRGSSVPSEGEHLLAEMKRIAVVDALQRDSATLSPQRASRLSKRPIYMPSLGTYDDIISKKRKNAKIKNENKKKQQKQRKQIEQQHLQHHNNKQNQNQNMPSSLTTMKLSRNNIQDKYSQTKLIEIEQMLNSTMTKKQKQQLLKSRIWNNNKLKNSKEDHSVWHRYCNDKISKAPIEMRNNLLNNQYFHIVQDQSINGSIKKKKNHKAKMKLENFLLQRKTDRKDNLWLTYAKMAEPKLTSQWFEYLERYEIKGNELNGDGGGSGIIDIYHQ